MARLVKVGAKKQSMAGLSPMRQKKSVVSYGNKRSVPKLKVKGTVGRVKPRQAVVLQAGQNDHPTSAMANKLRFRRNTHGDKAM